MVIFAIFAKLYVDIIKNVRNYNNYLLFFSNILLQINSIKIFPTGLGVPEKLRITVIATNLDGDVGVDTVYIPVIKVDAVISLLIRTVHLLHRLAAGSITPSRTMLKVMLKGFVIIVVI